MNHALAVILFVAMLVVIHQILWFVISRYAKRVDVVDIAWGLNGVIIAWSAFLLNTYSVRTMLVAALVTVWGLRLALHLFVRIRHSPEDKRYQAIKDAWGAYGAVGIFLQIFLLQALLIMIVTSPVMVIALTSGQHVGWLDLLGMFIWLIGFLCEMIADKQLKDFMRESRQRSEILDTGLWRYSRHPNFLGEIMQWWGVWLIAMHSPYGWLSIIGPLTITYFITCVSGIPLIERQLAQNPRYVDYQRTTSILIPWFPKK